MPNFTENPRHTLEQSLDTTHLLDHLCKLGVLRKQLVDGRAGHTGAAGDACHTTRLSREQLGTLVTV